MQLRAMMQEHDLPTPYSWRLLPYLASARPGADTVECNFLLAKERAPGQEEEEEERAVVERKHILSSQVLPGASLRFGTASSEESECRGLHVVDEVSAADIASFAEDPPAGRLLHMGSVQLAEPWHGAAALEEAPMYVHTFSARKQPYVDLLVAKEAQAKASALSRGSSSSSGGAVEVVGEHGFATLFSFMAGRSVECALCLGETVRPTITRCVHSFCLACILDVLSKEKEAAKCPICRRKLDKAALIEVDTSVAVAEEGEEPATDAAAAPSPVKEAAPPSPQVQAAQPEPAGHGVKKPRRAASSRSTKKAAGSSSSAPAEASAQDGDTKLIIPEFSLHGSAPVVADLEDFLGVIPAWDMMPRDVRYPSLDSAILTYLDCFQTRKDCLSSRMGALLADMAAVRASDPAAKFVIFSQHVESLTAVSNMLRAAERMRAAEDGAGSAHGDGVEHSLYKSVIFDGKAATRSNISAFIEDPACSICLVTTGAAATGLTLTVAQTCYFIEPTHEAAEEAQALNRVHRIGQARPVRCVVFYAEDTPEERLLALRQSHDCLTHLLVADSSYTPAPEGASRKRARQEAGGEGLGGRGKGKGKKAAAAAPPGAAAMRRGLNFFSVENMSLLLGLTDERIARGEQLRTVVDLVEGGYGDDEEDEDEGGYGYDDDDPRFYPRAAPRAARRVIALDSGSDSEYDSDFFDD